MADSKQEEDARGPCGAPPARSAARAHASAPLPQTLASAAGPTCEFEAPPRWTADARAPVRSAACFAQCDLRSMTRQRPMRRLYPASSDCACSAGTSRGARLSDRSRPPARAPTRSRPRSMLGQQKSRSRRAAVAVTVDLPSHHSWRARVPLRCSRLCSAPASGGRMAASFSLRAWSGPDGRDLQP